MGAGRVPSNTLWPEPSPRSTSVKWHLDPSSRLATIDIGRKVGGTVHPFKRELDPHLTHSRLGRRLSPYQVPSGILIYSDVWSQQTWAENWGCTPLGWVGSMGHEPKIGELLCPFLGGCMGPHVTQCGLGRGLPRTKWHLDQRSHFAAIHGPKLGAVSHFVAERDSHPHLTQCRLSRGLLPYLVAS